MLRASIDCPCYDARYFDPLGAQDLYFPIHAPFLKLAAVHDADGGGLTLFALNRHLTDEMPLSVDLDGFGTLTVRSARELRDDDLTAANTRDAMDRVRPAAFASLRVTGRRLEADLAPASWNVIRLG